MKMKRRLRILLTAFCLVVMGQVGNRVYAQDPQTIEVGPHFGATAYVGELNVWRHLPQWDWKALNQFDYDWGVLARYNYNTRWSFRIDYTHGRFRASDAVAAWRPEAGLAFKSTVNDLALMAEFNFLDYYTGHIRNTISPYIFGGISGFMFDTEPKNAEQIQNYSKIALSVPFGLGLKLSLSKHLATTAEWRMHYTLTDYLDDVSGVYPAGDEIFPEGYQRGNTQTNDWFGMINVSLTWKFVIPNSSACKMNID